MLGLVGSPPLGNEQFTFDPIRRPPTTDFLSSRIHDYISVFLWLALGLVCLLISGIFGLRVNARRHLRIQIYTDFSRARCHGRHAELLVPW